MMSHERSHLSVVLDRDVGVVVDVVEEALVDRVVEAVVDVN